MRKIILSLPVFASALFYSQCTIVGKDVVTANEVENYTLENDNAQCAECFQWSVAGNSKLEGDLKKKTIQLKNLTPGKTQLTATVLSKNGSIQCSKNIEIKPAEIAADKNTNVATTTAPETKKDCNIQVRDIKELKSSENLVDFYPIPPNSNFKYYWTATYESGSQKESTEIVPQFPYSKGDGILSLKLKIVSDKCINTSSKTYDSNFWKFY